jgi:hypothetical protein
VLAIAVLAIANLSVFKEDCFGETPKPARATRALSIDPGE